MNKLILILLSSFLVYNMLTAQVDPVARSILDRFSEKALSAPAVTMEFDLNIEDEVDKSSSSSKGKIVIKNNMYRLELPENIIWFDGSSVWTLAPEVEEVTVNHPDTLNTGFVSNPDDLFTLYRNGYKLRLLEENERGTVIDLYPEAIDTDFIRIRLLIDKSYDLVEAEYKRKDGYNVFIIITRYDVKSKYENSFFFFDSKKYPDAYIIDMR